MAPKSAACWTAAVPLSVFAGCIAVPVVEPACDGWVSDQPTFPIRAAFYYPWFPETWDDPGTRYSPELGQYDSDDPDTIRRHVEMLTYGGFAAGISSWWGPGTPTDERFPRLLEAATHECFRWAVYYENEGYANPSPTEIRSDLEAILKDYADHPAYLRVNLRPVVFVYGGSEDGGCGVADRWAQANAGLNAYVVLKVGSDAQRACPAQPHGWHHYGPADARLSVLPFSVTISPGFWHANEAAPRLDRDPSRWQDDVEWMQNSGASFHLVSMFNEWGEGTAVEPAREWRTESEFGAYLDTLHAATR